MHELAVTENILEIALRHACQAKAIGVTGVYLIIGELSSIVDDSVQFYWDIISKGTLCEGANLHFERIPAQLQCQRCNYTYIIQGELSACPQCTDTNVTIVTGEEFRLESIEIKEDEH